MIINADLFRIGPGYIEYWIHEPRAHWTLSNREDLALRELEEAFLRLIHQRDEVGKARQAFAPTSSFTTGGHPEDDVQQDLYRATSDFFLSYYSALSALASFLKCFSKEIGEVPSKKNSHLLTWLEPFMLLREKALPHLLAARDFRTLLDHKADRAPSTWATYTDSADITRVALHGPGPIRPGAQSTKEVEWWLPEDHTWIFIAPDEDRVLSSLAIQMNAMFPRIQPHRLDQEAANACSWEPKRGKGDPRSGYPTLAHTTGWVKSVPRESSPKKPPAPASRLQPDDRVASDIIAGYFTSDGNLKDVLDI